MKVEYIYIFIHFALSQIYVMLEQLALLPASYVLLIYSGIILMRSIIMGAYNGVHSQCPGPQWTSGETEEISTNVQSSMSRDLKFCLLVPYCHWFNLHGVGVLCCTPISPGLPVIPARGFIETASGFHLPTSVSFLWEEDQMSWRNAGSARPSCGVSTWQRLFVVWKARWVDRVPVPLRQVCAALLMTVDTPAHL